MGFCIFPRMDTMLRIFWISWAGSLSASRRSRSKLAALMFSVFIRIRSSFSWIGSDGSSFQARWGSVPSGSMLRWEPNGQAAGRIPFCMGCLLSKIHTHSL